MSSRSSVEERAAVVREVIEAARTLDITLTFEPYATPYLG